MSEVAFDTRPVRDFVPLLAERKARGELATWCADGHADPDRHRTEPILQGGDEAV